MTISPLLVLLHYSSVLAVPSLRLVSIEHQEILSTSSMALGVANVDVNTTDMPSVCSGLCAGDRKDHRPRSESRHFVRRGAKIEKCNMRSDTCMNK